MNILAAVLPILVVIVLMIGLRWSGQASGAAGWIVTLLAAFFVFGLTWDVWRVSQLKGLLLSLNVIAILWPALFLYEMVESMGGIQASADALQLTIAKRGLLLIVVAWIFGGLLEGLSGFGIPVAIIAPLLVALGVTPLRAVAAAAVGHSWAVTFGSMGIVYQTLISVVEIDSAALAPAAAFLLGCACLLCGIGAAFLLGELRYWREVIFLAVWMGLIQYFAVAAGLSVMGSFLASLAGIAVSFVIGRGGENLRKEWPENLKFALFSYGLLSLMLTLITVVKPLSSVLSAIAWSRDFPAVETMNGWITAAGPSITIRPLTHPGSMILISIVLSWFYFKRTSQYNEEFVRTALRKTWKAVYPSTLTVLFMVGLSTMMEHSGMTILIARTLSSWMGNALPVASPLIGMLGAFTTGSNNNSNVLFGPLQKNIAILLGVAPHILVAAQTSGGSLGSMIAPVKLAIGCSTVGLAGKDGQVLRQTLPIGLLIGLIIGIITLVWLSIG